MKPDERRVLRYEVPVDDEWHTLAVVGEVVHVGCRYPGIVEFWATPSARPRSGRPRRPAGFSAERSFRVFGTGQPISDGSWVGTDYAAGGALVWHLFEREVVS